MMTIAGAADRSPRVRIEFTRDEAAMLRESLTSYVTNLRRELAGTEDRDSQRVLAQREEFLNGMLDRLTAADAD